ncbi:MAG: PAS domain S-box protein [Anaerolineales bacterium]
MRQKFAALVSETRPYRERNPIKTKDGSIIELDFYIIGNIQPGQHLIVGRDVTEKKKIEWALFESEERYRMLFETAGDAIFLMENDTFVSCNQATVQMFGCRDESEILDHTPWDFSPKTQPDGRNSKEKGLEIIRSVIEGEPKKIYWKHLKKDGAPFDVEVTLNAFLLRGKTFIQAVLRDITNRMQAEKELRESEARYSSLVNVSPNSIFIVQDGNYVYANPAGAKMLGYNNPQDVVGLSTIKAMTEKSKQEVFEREKRALQGKTNALTLLEIQQPDGSIRQVESISIPYRFRDRPAALAIGIDVTDRVAQESMLSNFFKVAPLGVGVMVDNKFIQFNNRFCQMVGYTPEELADKEARMLYFSDEEYESVGQQKNRQIKETGIGVVETRFKRKDGSSIEVLLSSIPLDPKNPGKGLNITALDISDRKRAEQLLKNLNEELEERVRLRTQQLENKTVELESFSYSISHDLRAPLRAIHGFSQILLEEYANNWGEEPRELMENINAASQKMDQLIDGLLMLSRLGQKDILLVPTDVCEIAEQVFANLSTQIPDREIEFQTSPCPKVWVDQQLIETALTNLIANAVKFTRPRAKALIEFGVEKRDETAVFYVRDNGVGFDQKYAEKLFSPFQRLESEGDFEGMGIGLSIVKRIVERHDGEIWVQAKEGRGATFYFTLNADPSVSLPENYVD